MATLNTSFGWTQGDQVRLLIASGLSVGSYQINSITIAMNQLGDIAPEAVGSVLDLIDEFELAQSRYTELNSNGDSRILIKADVLEWAESKGFSYNPITEISRIRGILSQYLAFCDLYNNTTSNGNTAILRRS
tara:strand:- start:38 stop:436 length:399 start_codon:yes stop_codon:yes gene_type:complete